MSRKRSYRQSTMISQPDASSLSDGIDFEYYKPGCYTPQTVIGCSMPWSYTYLHQLPVQWHCCNTATYVVDNFGRVYYLSDFEHHLQLPSSVSYEAETIYQYHYETEKSVMDYVDDTDDEAYVSPRKRERFEDIENDAKETVIEKHLRNKIGDKLSPESSRDVYRSEEGYLVEEPVD